MVTLVHNVLNEMSYLSYYLSLSYHFIDKIRAAHESFELLQLVVA